MICWLLSTENCRFMKALRYYAICNTYNNSILPVTNNFFWSLSYLQRGIYVAGLREEIVASPEQVLDLMEFGECKFCFAPSLMLFLHLISAQKHGFSFL